MAANVSFERCELGGGAAYPALTNAFIFSSSIAKLTERKPPKSPAELDHE